MHRIRLIGFLFMCFAPGWLSGQAPATPDSSDVQKLIGARLHYGKILIHSRHLRPIKDSYPLGVSVYLAWQFLGKKSWEFCNCYPRTGLILTFYDFDNKPILGYGIRLMTYAEPVFLTRHRLNLSVRMAGGLAYCTRPFDSTDNTYNQSYSTYFNFPLEVGLGLHFRLNDQWTIRASASYDHISNGGVNLPNKGINWVTGSAGFDYSFRPFDYKARARRLDRSPPERRLRFRVGGLWSFSNAFVGSNRQYGIYGGFVKGLYYLGRWSGLSLGTEWVADRSRWAIMDMFGEEGSYHRGSVTVGHQFLLGHVVFSQELGIYYFDQYRVNDPVYQRYGLTVLLGDHLFVGCNVKAHRHVADFADLRMGYEF